MSKEDAVLGASLGILVCAGIVYALDTWYQMSLRGSVFYDSEYVLKDLSWAIPRKELLGLYLGGAAVGGVLGGLVGLFSRRR